MAVISAGGDVIQQEFEPLHFRFGGENPLHNKWGNASGGTFNNHIGHWSWVSGFPARREDCHEDRVSVPVGISGCTHWFEFLKMNCLPCLTQASGQKFFYEVRVGQLSFCSLLFLPPGVPLMRRRHASLKALPKTVEFGGCSPPPMWEV